MPDPPLRAGPPGGPGGDVMEPDTLIRLVRQAGVVGEGGAGFPAHRKYDTRVDTVIANGCECEPLLHSDQYLMAHHAPEIVQALQTLVQTCGAQRGVVAIKRKYDQAARALAPLLEEAGLELARLDDFYPAGDEQVLVYEVTGHSIPPLGLPLEVGALVANVGTLYSVHNALAGRPVTHKLVTITGEVARPGLLRVPVGTRVSECLQACGGLTMPEAVVILGGPMMGRLLAEPGELERAVITKTTGGVIALPRGHYLEQMATRPLEVMRRQAAAACIQCRYCTELCPRHLIGHDFAPHQVMRAFASGHPEASGLEQAALCSECGLCELFSCPMRLSPRRINAALKAGLRQQGRSYQGPRRLRPEQSRLRGFRKIPVSRLALKTAIAGYLDLHPPFAGELEPEAVDIPLGQHIGVPAQATVKVGDRVEAGDCIGEIPPRALGARVHASIPGRVTAVGPSVSIQRAK